MPRRDGTGPIGCGPMSGRSLGFCTGTNGRFAGRTGRRFSRGFGYRCGVGFSSFFDGEPAVMTEQEFLTKQKEVLESRLENINKQIESL